MTRQIVSVLGTMVLGACSVVGIRSGYERRTHAILERVGEDQGKKRRA